MKFRLVSLFCVLVTQLYAADQTLNLAPGWNAVWVNVEPADKAVDSVFTNSSVTIVASPRAVTTSAEFASDVTEQSFGQEGWQVWRRNSPLQQSTLGEINGFRPYLVFLDGSSSLSITVLGKGKYVAKAWQAGRYNLAGFSLKVPVAFSTFFSSVTTKHAVNRMFRLQANGDWVSVTGSDLMQPGEAYWIFSNGPSTFDGPGRISFATERRLEFGPGPGTVTLPDPQGNPGDTIAVTPAELTIINDGDADQTVSLVKEEPASGNATNDPLRVFEVVPSAEDLSYAIGPNGQIDDDSFGNFAVGESRTITLGGHRNWSTGSDEREVLFRVEFDHHFFWLPAHALNEDVPAPAEADANTQATGLWIGQVTVDEVASLTDSGNPVKKTTSKAPIRLLLHVDGTGSVSLLSHVMLMRRGEGQENVLVVDETKIPFFEGIEVRNGKRVGKRLESTSYDLPRKNDRETQAALLADVAAAFSVTEAEVTDEQIATYVSGQRSRPVSLVEDYHLSWPLSGGLTPGSTLNTMETLALDPFHRSNPFRHAFHPQHATGYTVTRSMTLTLDDGEESAIRTGEYEEVLTGLAAQPITIRGRFELNRVSRVSTLQ